MKTISKQNIAISKSISKLQFFLGFILTFFGLMTVIGLLFTPFPWTVRIIPFIWTIVSLVITYNGFKRGFSNKGNGDYEFNDSSDLAFDEKLRRLEALKIEGLISESEYNQKRKEILDDKW